MAIDKSNDLELPTHVTETVTEMSALTGVTTNSIHQFLSTNRGRFLRIEIPPEDEEEIIEDRKLQNHKMAVSKGWIKEEKDNE